MTTEAAKVVIDAEDLASKKLADAARNAEASIKQIKDVSGRAKASTEFIGTLATTLGGSELGGYAGQLAQLTERVSAFSEVSKAGGAGALAFKGGLVALVATLSFQVGKALGNVIFQTEKATREFDRAKEAAAELDDKLSRSRARIFENAQEDIELIRDPAEKRAAQEALFKQLENDLAGARSQLKASQKAADEWADAWKITGDRKAFAEQAQQEVETNKERLRQLEEMHSVMQRTTSERQRINEQLKADAAEQDAKISKSDAYLESLSKELAMLEAAAAGRDAVFGEKAAQNTFGDAARYEAEQLLEEIDLLKEKAAAEKAAEDAAQKAADIKEREIERLKLQRIELEKGKEAARAFALEQQGLDKATAQRLAAEQSAIDKLREEKNKKDEKETGLSSTQVGTAAVQSRLLTRGPAEKGIDKIAKATEETVKKLESINATLTEQSRGPNLQFELVGA